jgi:hypothetical protein
MKHGTEMMKRNGKGSLSRNEETEYDRFVTVDGAETDDEGELDQRPIEARSVTRVGDEVEVAGVKWKRVENVTRDVREGLERFDPQRRILSLR